MINVTPVDDIKPHTDDSTCGCDPRVKIYEGEIIIIHNSFDGREGIEQVNEILNDTKN